MTTPPTPAASPTLEQRLANLEAQNRRLRIAVGAIALGLILCAAGHTFFLGAVRATVVEARQVIVRDPAGRVRIVLGTDDSLTDGFRAKDNPGLLLCDEKRALRAQLYASEELTGLGLFDPDGKPRAALTHRNGWSGCWLVGVRHGDPVRRRVLEGPTRFLHVRRANDHPGPRGTADRRRANMGHPCLQHAHEELRLARGCSVRRCERHPMNGEQQRRDGGERLLEWRRSWGG
jgi:hypothetical protein